jgi:hypothetical protein
MSSSRGPALGAALVVAAVALFLVLHKSGDASNVTTGVTKIQFKDGSPVGGVRDITVNKGDRVRLDVTPDVPAEVHVEGYDIEKDTKPGETVHDSFIAGIEGEFVVEVHHLVNGEEQEGVQVASLRVDP